VSWIELTENNQIVGFGTDDGRPSVFHYDIFLPHGLNGTAAFVTMMHGVLRHSAQLQAVLTALVTECIVQEIPRHAPKPEVPAPVE
jgi:hypothetical protein